MDRAEPASGQSLKVSVACSAEPGQAWEAPVSVPAGATVLEAIRASGVLERFPQLDISARDVGVWGRPCALATTLSEGDRVEIYRPLAMDPMQARRLRATRPKSAR